MVELREITEHNLDECLALRVADHQNDFVASNAHSLAQAWVQYDAAYPFAIYADDVMVGFIMMGFYKRKGVYTLWRFMIDERFQGKGYGRAALLLGIGYFKEKFNVNEIHTAFLLGNTIAEALYSCVGFQRTGEVEGSQVGMCLKIA